MQNQNPFRVVILTAMILFVALARLFDHPDNFTPVKAMALFGGAYFMSRRWAFGIPLLAMFLSDVALYYIRGYELLTPVSLLVYATFALITWLGFRLRGRV